MTPKEIIAKTRVDFLGEAGDTVAALIIAALKREGYEIVKILPKTKRRPIVVEDDVADGWLPDGSWKP